MTTEKPNPTKELALLLALSTLWGASYSFIKIGVKTIPPVTLIAARTFIAGLILAAIIRWRGLSLPKMRPPGGGSCFRPASTAWFPSR